MRIKHSIRITEEKNTGNNKVWDSQQNIFEVKCPMPYGITASIGQSNAIRRVTYRYQNNYNKLHNKREPQIIKYKL